MESFVFRHVTYAYPEQETPALLDVSLSIRKGDFTILCGPSGCGKTTLLRHMKTCLTPHGRLTGDILFEGTPLSGVDDRTQAQRIGFVFQSPDNQIVTDKVWHELAFGAESLGLDTPTIRRRVAEMASFFGIEKWFHKQVNELSGGQKQLLSLASVMVMQPSVLVLDEPTSQLDPIAAEDFLSVLGKINRELGTTVILSEHRLEEAFPFARQVVVMEQGRVLCDGTPEEVGLHLKSAGHAMFLAMPTAMRVWAGLDTETVCPLTVRDGSAFLTAYADGHPLHPLCLDTLPPQSDEVVLSGDDLFFRYEKESPDVLKGLSFSLHRGEFYTLLGGNGSGKSTALRVLSGISPAYRGTVKANGRIGLLPQNPQTLFVKRTVREDLFEVFRGRHVPGAEQERKVAYAVRLCRLERFLDHHPYDISGGEQQRTALAKVLLTEPDILLLDEPTKGMDAEFKQAFASILKQLLKNGISILMVSHDVVFSAEYAHRCGLFFDGYIVAEDRPREFFSGNSFYTTPANRMARPIIPEAVTVTDILSVLGGQIPEEIRPDESVPAPLPPPKETAVSYKPKPLSVFRKILAAVWALIAVAIFFIAIHTTDLNDIITSHGLGDPAKIQIFLSIGLIVDLIAFIFTVSRRSAPSVDDQIPKEKRKLSKRTAVASVLILLLIPLTIFAGVFYFGNRSYRFIAPAVLIESMLPFFLVFEGRKPKPRELVTIAVLCAIAIAGRAVFFMLPQFKPVMAITIIAGVAFGGETGFLVGSTTMLVSNMLYSQGPWTPWQMFSMGIIGFLAGILFRKGLLRRGRLSLAIFGAVSAVVIYGGIMNTASALLRNAEVINGQILLAYLISGFPMDLIHGAATFVFLMLIAEPMLEKLDRIKVKYGLLG